MYLNVLVKIYFLRFLPLKKVANVGVDKDLMTGFLGRQTQWCPACGIKAVNEDLNNASIVYLIGEDHNVDTLNSLIADPSKLIIYQGAHNQFFTNSSDLVLPTTSLLESSGLFFSFDGRVQKSNVVSKGLGEAKSYSAISSIFNTALLTASASAIPVNFFTPALLESDFTGSSVDVYIPSMGELNTTRAV